MHCLSPCQPHATVMHVVVQLLLTSQQAPRQAFAADQFRQMP